MKIFRVKISCIALSMLLFGSTFATTILAPGDIVFTTLNTDSLFTTAGCPANYLSSTNNLFSFVTRVNISSGTLIYFTDSARTGSALASNEGTLRFVATGDILAGATIFYNDCALSATPMVWSRSGGFDPAISGDTILVYQGTGSNPQFIYGVGRAINTPWISVGPTNSNNSYIPPALTLGTTAVFPTSMRNATYSCNSNLDIASPSFLSSISNSGNWISSNISGFSTSVCTFIPPIDLSINKTYVSTGGLSSGLVRVGQPLSYVLTLRSLISTGTSIQVVDLLPLGFTYLSHNTSTGNYTTGSGIWNIGTISSWSVHTLTITGSLNRTGVIFNTGQILSYSGTDINTGNNISTLILTGVTYPPIVINDTGLVVEDGSGTITILSNDIGLISGDILSITGVIQPNNGSIEILGSGLVYYPVADYCGSDVLSYQAINQYGEVSTGSATVSIEVTCINDAPSSLILTGSSIRENQSLATLIGYLSGLDMDSSDLTYMLVAGAGDDDDFIISGNQLLSNLIFDFESQTGYMIRIMVSDGSGGIFERGFLIDIVDIDDIAPVVTLSGANSITINLGSGYIDQGAQRTDNADGSGNTLNSTRSNTGSFAQSGSVNTSVAGTYFIQYLKVDAAGNLSNIVTRTVTVVDTIAPVVILSGSETVTLLSGSTFSDTGAGWTDDTDGSGVILTATSGSVNTSQSGTYVLSYTYTDIAGNVSNIVTRTVNVVEPNLNQPIVNPSVAGGKAYENIPLTDGTTQAISNNDAIFNPIKKTGNDVVFTTNPLLTEVNCYTPNNSLIDVGHHPDDEFRVALQMMIAYELTSMKSVTAFEPSSQLTRAQAAKFFTQYAINVLCRIPDLTIVADYNDINQSDTSLIGDIVFAKQLGIMKGGPDNTFRPNDQLTRSEFTASLVRLVSNQYLDESDKVWRTPYDQAARNLGLLKTNTDMEDYISRQDAALIYYRLYQNPGFKTLASGVIGIELR